MPACFAASITSVPAGALTVLPSIVSVTKSGMILQEVVSVQWPVFSAGLTTDQLTS